MIAAMLVLEPIFEADLPPEQYAYRPGRNAQQAVVKVDGLLFRGHPEVIDAGASSFGIGQRGGVYFDEARTSVYKLFRATRVEANTNIDPARQLAFWPRLAICHPGRETTSVSRRLRNVDGEAVPELSPASAKIHRRAHPRH
jgi:hypothetical protein